MNENERLKELSERKQQLREKLIKGKRKLDLATKILVRCKEEYRQLNVKYILTDRKLAEIDGRLQVIPSNISGRKQKKSHEKLAEMIQRMSKDEKTALLAKLLKQDIEGEME